MPATVLSRGISPKETPVLGRFQHARVLRLPARDGQLLGVSLENRLSASVVKSLQIAPLSVNVYLPFGHGQGAVNMLI